MLQWMPSLVICHPMRLFPFWNDKARRGYILSFVAGPPCETFTKSRFRSGGPPPLRSLLHRWGLPGLMTRFHRQVECGNFLWRFTTSMITSQMAAGKGGIFERPAPFNIDDGPCRGGIHTWAFPEIVALLKWPSLVLHLVDQGKYGQICRKPTGFMTLNHHQAADLFSEWLLPRAQWRLNSVVMAWNAAAKCFATAPLKEYPSQLNAALASIVMSDLDSPPRVCGDEVDSSHFRGFVSRTSHLYQLLEGCEQGTMQPDWHRA